MRKAVVTLGGVALAGTSEIAWRFVSGVAPYTTTFSVHHTEWKRKLNKLVGTPLVLEVRDARGQITRIKDVYILHEAPSDSPHRVSFVVADKRWKWQYKMIARDFNMPRKTGDRTANFEQVPVETRQVFDKYDYYPYSLDNGQKWTAKKALERVLELLETQTIRSGSGSARRVKKFRIESFPIEVKNSSKGQFTLQGVTLRDQGDAALARLLSFIPGAAIYINAEGLAVVYDATDLSATELHINSLPVSTWDGERAAWIDRKHIRPRKLVLHYQREVEVVFDYSDDYGGTRANPGAATPYLDNVLPTVDPETNITEFDPEEGREVTKRVPPGTWVTVDKWLAAMDDDKPSDSLPWTFETIKRHWLKGDLEGVLGARGLDQDDEANIAARVQVLRQHFRQTFRINRRYMERVRDLRAVRVALIDPVSGARAPAAAWSQACIIPSTKGKRMAVRKDPDAAGVFRNVDFLAPSKNDSSKKLIDTSPGPARVNVIDKDLGIFRIEWVASPYGTVDSFVPCHLVGTNNQQTVVTRDLAKQDDKPMGAAMQVEGGSNGIFLRDTLELKAMLTIVPAAPNNERQFHRVEVEAGDVKDLYSSEFRIQQGVGPDLEVFVPPGETTARFAWSDDTEADNTVQNLLGLRDDDDDGAGIEGTDLPGFVLINEERELADHSISLGAELLAPFADNVQGVIATAAPRSRSAGGGLKLVGNMASTTLRVASAPSAKVDAIHQFPGQQKPVSRMALMSDAARAVILGVVPFDPE